MTNEKTTQKVIYSTTEIAKIIRKEVKVKYPNCKFSISTKYYSGGSNLCINLISADFKIIKEFKDISEEAILQVQNRSNYKIEEIQKFQLTKYHQLNRFVLTENYNPTLWCNGVFLTEEGHNMLGDIVKMTDVYNWNNSDTSIDYFDVNFYLDIEIGKWNKDFIQGVKHDL